MQTKGHAMPAAAVPCIDPAFTHPTHGDLARRRDYVTSDFSIYHEIRAVRWLGLLPSQPVTADQEHGPVK